MTRILIFSPDRVRRLKLGVRAAKLEEALKKSRTRVVSLPDFNIRRLSPLMFLNYIKLLYFILTRRDTDLVLFENERSERLLKFFKRLGFRLALDIRDNRALQRSAYRVDDDPEKMELIKEVLERNIELCDYVFVVSQSCKELYPERYHEKIHIIENASDPELFRFSELPGDRRVGFVSGIAPGRGIELLIDAIHIVAERVPDVELVIGGSPHKETVEYLSGLKKRYESSLVRFREDVFYSVNANSFMQECYLTVIPHPDHIHYHTTIPVKLFDSLSSGRPVVATNCKETARILLENDCGVVSDFSASDLASKIAELLLDRDRAQMMGYNGRRIVEERYNWKRMAERIIEITGVEQR